MQKNAIKSSKTVLSQQQQQQQIRQNVVSGILEFMMPMCSAHTIFAFVVKKSAILLLNHYDIL